MPAQPRPVAQRHQSASLLRHLPLAVKAITCVMDKFHRLESIEPAEKPFPKRGLRRAVPNDFSRHLSEPMLAQKRSHGFRQTGRPIGCPDSVPPDSGHSFEKSAQVPKCLERISSPFPSPSVIAPGFAPPKRRTLGFAGRRENSGFV